MAQKVFISYSHADSDFVQEIAQDLNARGVDVWIDKWEIKAGDSIVRKIFEEGLANAKIFVVVLSKSSVQSKWVKEELDVATVQRIEKVCRVVPILMEECDIPMSLRALRWIDMRASKDPGIDEINNLFFDIESRPPLGSVPDYIKGLKRGVPGLSARATTIAAFFAKEDIEGRSERAYSGQAIEAGTSLPVQDINDGVDELKEQGLVKTRSWFGTHPYDFGQAEPTYALFLRMKDSLPYNPEEDIIIVVSVIAAVKETNGKDLEERTKLPIPRLNRAMDYVQDYALAQVINFLGTAPYHFGLVQATRHTRDFANEHAK